MPKLTNRNPKLGRNGIYAVVRYKGKTHRLGKHGTPEALKAYNRFCVELQTNPAFLVPKDERDITLDEVAAAYLVYAKSRFGKTDYVHYRTALSFAVEVYGDQPADAFSYQNLRTVRSEMVRSGRFCRDMINKYTGRIRTAFSWGVENGIVDPGTLAKLRILRPLERGEPGTFDHDEREGAPIEVVAITLRYTSPTVSAMAQVQTMTGLRPSELCKLTVGDIDRSDPDGWVYVLKHHKTARKTGKKKSIVFGREEQKLILPYLIDKKPENAVFSPRTAMREHFTQRRAKRQTPVQPSQVERDKRNVGFIDQSVNEFYDSDTYRKAIEYAIKAARRAGEDVPHWVPYQLRHTAGTETSRTLGREKAQILLTHKTSAMTARYDHSEVAVLKELARNRVNPFAVPPVEGKGDAH